MEFLLILLLSHFLPSHKVLTEVATTIEKRIDDQQLIKLLKSRDTRGMEMLYDQYSSVLYGVIFWITGDEKKSEEVLFRTFTYVWNHFTGSDVSVHNICLWMLNIARKFSLEMTGAELRLKLFEATIHTNVETACNEKAILNAVFFQGMSMKAMAACFNHSEEKIKMLLNDAIHNLKKEYVAR